MSAILAVENLEKSLGSVVAARDINVSIPAEQTIGVIGANGAGKTTFINMITGHLTPTKGTIRFEDRDITGMASRDITRLGISRSFQVAQVFPTMTVLDIGPGEGWYTALLAPALAKSGQYVATTNDPNGPADLRATFYGQRFKAFLDRSPEIYGKAQTIVVDPKAPKIGKEAAFDLVVIMRGVHGMKNNGTMDVWLEEIHRSLKPGGVLGIEEHRAAAGADPAESAKKGYVPEKWLIEQVEGAGFKLAGKSEINANPKDTKDYPEGVWTLSPTFRLGDKDREKYAAIGESDRMTLKFVKTTSKPAGK